MKRRLLKFKWRIRAAINYLHGYALSPIHRCRVCDHTLYSLPCPYHSGLASGSMVKRCDEKCWQEGHCTGACGSGPTSEEGE